MNEIKVLFAGTVGSGKTSAIKAVSETGTVDTDVMLDDEDRVNENKDTTTVAFDYGYLNLGNDTLVHLFGTPGQERFDYMWEILSEGVLGFIILVDAQSKDCIEEYGVYLKNFEKLVTQVPFVIGITHLDDQSGDTIINSIYSNNQKQGLVAPILKTDARSKDDVINLLRALIAMVEAQIVAA